MAYPIVPKKASSTEPNFNPANAEPCLRSLPFAKTNLGDICDYGASRAGQLAVPSVFMPAVESASFALDRAKSYIPNIGRFQPSRINLTTFFKEMGAHISWRVGLDFWGISKQLKGEYYGIKDEPYPFEDIWEFLQDRWGISAFLLYGLGQTAGQLYFVKYMEKELTKRGWLQQPIKNKFVRGLLIENGRKWNVSPKFANAAAKLAGLSVGTYLGWVFFDIGLIAGATDDEEFYADSILYPFVNYSPFGGMGWTIGGFTYGGYLGQNLGLMGGESITARISGYIPSGLKEFVNTHATPLPLPNGTAASLAETTKTLRNAISKLEGDILVKIKPFATLGAWAYHTGVKATKAMLTATNQEMRIIREVVRSLQAAREAATNLETLAARAAGNAASADNLASSLSVPNYPVQNQRPAAESAVKYARVAAGELGDLREAARRTAAVLEHTNRLVAANGFELPAHIKPTLPELVAGLNEAIAATDVAVGGLRKVGILNFSTGFKWWHNAFRELPWKTKLSRFGSFILKTTPGAFKAALQIVTNVVLGFAVSSVAERIGKRHIVPATYRFLGPPEIEIEPPELNHP